MFYPRRPEAKNPQFLFARRLTHRPPPKKKKFALLNHNPPIAAPLGPLPHVRTWIQAPPAASYRSEIGFGCCPILAQSCPNRNLGCSGPAGMHSITAFKQGFEYPSFPVCISLSGPLTDYRFIDFIVNGSKKLYFVLAVSGRLRSPSIPGFLTEADSVNCGIKRLRPEYQSKPAFLLLVHT